MSKKCKSASKEKRKAMKRARKAAMQAKYQAFREAGKNSKSKRCLLRGKKRKTARQVDHPYGKCGNPGCIKCFGIHFKPFLLKGKPHRMPHWMYLQWKKLEGKA